MKGWGDVPCSVFRVPRCGIGGFGGFEEFESLKGWGTFRVQCSVFRVVGKGGFCKDLISNDAIFSIDSSFSWR